MDSNVSDGPSLHLGDISDFTDIRGLGTISVAGTFMSFLVVLSARIANFGGVPLNTFFDMFGMEAVVSMVVLILILLQITRYLYTVFYEKGGKTWSPFVFICFLIGVHLIHDLIFYFAVISQVPKGKNDMIDILRAN
jgi:magnesium-transporting ATPase (P-type)